jgi:hypothetical protein
MYWFGLWFVEALLFAYWADFPPVEYVALVNVVLEMGGIALASWPIFAILNGMLDYLPLIQAETRVIRKWVRHAKGGDRYYVLLGPSWRAGRDQEKINLATLASFDTVEVGDRVQVEVHPGRFGLPWGARITNSSRPY